MIHISQDVKTTTQYVDDLREYLNRIHLSCGPKNSAEEPNDVHNRLWKLRDFPVGNKVLLLLPTKTNKLAME